MPAGNRATRRVRRRRQVVGISMVALVGAVVAFAMTRTHKGAAAPPCQAAAGALSYPLDLEQAASSTTIAATGKRMGLPNHAVTIALAAAMQESDLHNLDHGDRDSLGLFQQRPSQGWGSASQVTNPRHAATAFYQHLLRVAGWQDLSVNDAAQRVQRSAAPDAYAQWEAEARVLAQALTGEVAVGLSCRFAPPKFGLMRTELTQAMNQELGAPGLNAEVTSARGRTVAAWLVGHARQFGVRSIGFEDRTWAPTTGRWVADPSPAVNARIVTVA